MIAAIYARKSTDQHLPDAEKSVTRQIEHAPAYAARKGWTVDPAQQPSPGVLHGGRSSTVRRRPSRPASAD